MSIAYPLPASTRRSDYIATASQTVFGPTAWIAFAAGDIRVRRKLPGDTYWTTLSTGFTVALAAPDAGSVTVTFAAGQAAGTLIRVESSRIHPRITDVTRAGTIVSAPLEQELDLVATVLQELRRDVNDALPDGLEALVAQAAGFAAAADADRISAEAAATAADADRQSAEAAAANAAASAASINPANFVGQTGATGAANLPAGTTAQRPASPVAGQARFNSQTGLFEAYNGTAWGPLGGGGTVGGASDVNTARRANGKGLWWDDPSSQYVHAWASPRDYIIDLRDLMDDHYNGVWTQRTGINTGSNITPALILGMDRLRDRYGRGMIRIPPGTWLANTVIDPAKLSGITLEGVDPLSSIIVWAGTGNLLHASGAGGNAGGAWRRLGLFREDGFSSASIAMMLSGNATFQPDQFEIDNIYCSSLGTGFWTNNLQISAIARTSPQGQRVAAMRNLQLFRSGASNGLSVGLYNAVQCSIDNIGTYVGTGTLANYVGIGGGGTTATNSTQVTIERLACGGELNLTNSTRCRVDGFCGQLNIAATADFYNGWIDASAVTGSFGANSNVTVR